MTRRRRGRRRPEEPGGFGGACTFQNNKNSAVEEINPSISTKTSTVRKTRSAPRPTCTWPPAHHGRLEPQFGDHACRKALFIEQVELLTESPSTLNQLLKIAIKSRYKKFYRKLTELLLSRLEKNGSHSRAPTYDVPGYLFELPQHSWPLWGALFVKRPRSWGRTRRRGLGATSLVIFLGLGLGIELDKVCKYWVTRGTSMARASEYSGRNDDACPRRPLGVA